MDNGSLILFEKILILLHTYKSFHTDKLYKFNFKFIILIAKLTVGSF